MDKDPKEARAKKIHPGRDNFISTSELLKQLVSHLFGAEFPREDLLPLPYDSLDEHPLLTRALETGTTLIACDILLNALKAGRIALIAADQRPNGDWATHHPVARSVLNSLNALDVADDFLNGAGTEEDSSFPKWIEGKALILAVHGVENWLKSLAPMAYLPEVVERDGNELPNGYVVASSAICWVAGQEIQDWYALFQRGSDITDAISELESYSEANTDQEYYRAAQTLCALLASRHVRSHAANEIIRQMSDHVLTGSGVLRQTGFDSIKKPFQPIPKEAFLIRRAFSMGGNFEDCLVAEHPQGEEALAANESVWTHVRFFRKDLIEIWGQSEMADIEEVETDLASPARKCMAPEMPGRVPKRKAAVDHVQKLVENWNSGEPHPKSEGFISDLRKNFDLSRDEARQIWKKNTPLDWRKRGRPKATERE